MSRYVLSVPPCPPLAVPLRFGPTPLPWRSHQHPLKCPSPGESCLKPDLRKMCILILALSADTRPDLKSFTFQWPCPGLQGADGAQALLRSPESPLTPSMAAPSAALQKSSWPSAFLSIFWPEGLSLVCTVVIVITTIHRTTAARVQIRFQLHVGDRHATLSVWLNSVHATVHFTTASAAALSVISTFGTS